MQGATASSALPGDIDLRDAALSVSLSARIAVCPRAWGALRRAAAGAPPRDGPTLAWDIFHAIEIHSPLSPDPGRVGFSLRFWAEGGPVDVAMVARVSRSPGGDLAAARVGLAPG